MALQQIATSMFSISLRARMAALVSLAVLLIFLSVALAAPAQTLQVLHNFTGGADGGQPIAGVTLDQQGRVYGTTTTGGDYQDGAVYRLAHLSQGWSLSPVYSFGSQENDGNTPLARVVFGRDGAAGNLLGTTGYGGTTNNNCDDGCGVIWEITP